MKTKDDIERLEKTIGQLGAIHREISLLSKKSPNDAVNPFKLSMINGVIEIANEVLGHAYKPLEGFDRFDDDNAPSTSDVVFVVAHYIEEIRTFSWRSMWCITSISMFIFLEGNPVGLRPIQT